MNDQHQVTDTDRDRYTEVLPALADGYEWVLHIGAAEATLELIQPYTVNESERPLRYKVVNYGTFGHELGRGSGHLADEEFRSSLRACGIAVSAGYMRPAVIHDPLRPLRAMKAAFGHDPDVFDLPAIKDRLAGITSRDWEAGDEWVFGSPLDGTDRSALLRVDTINTNAEFIAHAPIDVALLVAEVERLRIVVRELEAR